MGLRVEYLEDKKAFVLSNDLITYVMQVTDYDILNHVYYGKKINVCSKTIDSITYPRVRREFEVAFSEGGIGERDYSAGVILHEYPSFGSGDYRQPALVACFSNGSRTTDLRYYTYEILEERPKLENLPSSYAEEAESKSLKIVLKDLVNELYVELYYTIFEDTTTIARSSRIINKSKEPVRLEKALSASIDFNAREFDLIHLNGTWARERMLTRETLTRGTKVLDSKRGTSSHQQTPFLALTTKNTDEFQGEVYGFQLIYSGSYEMNIERDPYEKTRVQLGIQSTGFNWLLEEGESLQTPEVIMNYSEKGLNGMSQDFHKFIKSHIIPRKYQTPDRPILINNWEGTYFAFDEDKIKAIIDEASDLGLELFVLDDGWFGKRDSDTSSLGDWYVHSDKLPNGLEEIANYTHEKGLKFGLWFEPEMISEDSDLYRSNPEYAIQTPEHPLKLGRDQYVLDFSNPAVVDNIYEQMCKILDSVEIDYIKWDMNRHLSQVYSLNLPEERQGEVWHRYVLGVYDLMERLINRYPDILFESCSGGGGRFDLGILSYMPQTWTSDNTDAVQRLLIQYGTSMMVPLNTMGAHVSAVPNHQTGRVTSLDMRFAVAIFGVFGYELDPTKLDPSAKEVIKEQVKFYKENRELIQTGTFIRLLSPFEGNTTSWMVVNSNKSQALVGYYEILNKGQKPLNSLKLKGLEEDALYKVQTDTTQKYYYADQLMNQGIYIYPQLTEDYSFKLFKLQKVDQGDLS